MANPPGRIEARSARMPGNCRRSTSPTLRSALLSRSRPAAEIPCSLQPFAARMAAIERAVPEEPTTPAQPCPGVLLDYGLQLAFRGELGLLERVFFDFTVGKVFQAETDAAMYRLSISSGWTPVPMMNSVEPPPMSITRRL